ncbi:MAG: hypothetical protein M3Q31_26540 [Actinomycetota bacterium]|nr:hypothetical protein [Actinomycetota bacterium]
MTTVIAAFVFVVVLACPAHMLWQMGRGKSASCAPGRSAVDEVGQRQAQLAEQVARMAAERG